MMKKILSGALVVSSVLVAGVAHADSLAGKAVTKSSVQYTCQQGKKVKVTYGFNKQNLPVYASARVGGKTRHMPINLYRSDDVTTTFGSEKNFSLGSEYMTLKNHRQKSVMITSPSQEILYKSCLPRKKR